MLLYLFIASFKLTQIHTLHQLFPPLFPHISQLIAPVCKLCDNCLNLLELLAWYQCRTSWEILAGWNWRFIGFYWAYQMFSSLYKGISNTVKDSPFWFMLLNESICLLKVHTQPVGVKVLFQFVEFFIYRDGIIWKPVNFLQLKAKVFPAHCNIHVPPPHNDFALLHFEDRLESYVYKDISFMFPWKLHVVYINYITEKKCPSWWWKIMECTYM